MTPLESLVACGTKLWLDSVDPDAVVASRAVGATGATSNPIIIADLIKSGRFDDELQALLQQSELGDEAVAWRMTDQLVSRAESEFASVHEATNGNDGYVSFELDPLLEDADCQLSTSERTSRYIELGKQWAAGHSNRMIKVPATDGGLGALEELVAAGITVNVTLIFSDRQYRAARDAVWKGAQRRSSLDAFKSVFSIFVSRIDVYTRREYPGLSDGAQGRVGIANAQRIWRTNHDFWASQNLPLDQEIIFASTGTKNPEDPVDLYVAALAGSDIQTNPPGTNAAIQELPGRVYTAAVQNDLPGDVLTEIDATVDFDKLEEDLMREGLAKFADPHKNLLELIAEKRVVLAG